MRVSHSYHHYHARMLPRLPLASGIDPKVDRARRSLCSVNLDGNCFEVLVNQDGDVCLPQSVTQPVQGASQLLTRLKTNLVSARLGPVNGPRTVP